MKIQYQTWVISVLLVLTVYLFSTQSVYAQKPSFEGFNFYHSDAQSFRSSELPQLLIQKAEIFPVPTTVCIDISIAPGNGCRTKANSLIDFGLVKASEIESPGNLQSNVLDIQSLMIFNQHSGKINLSSSTPGAGIGEFQTAHAGLNFDYTFIAKPGNHIFHFKDFSAETIGQIAGSGADIQIYLRDSSGVFLWLVEKHLRFTDKETLPDEKIDLFDFVNEGETVELFMDLVVIAYSATVQIQEDPALGALPAESSISFRITIPK